MSHVAFDAFARRAADLLDRRSLIAGLSGTLLAAGLDPFAASAKKKDKPQTKCKNLAKLCRQDLLPDVCEPDEDACRADINACCEKAAECKIKSSQGVIECCEAAGRCN